MSETTAAITGLALLRADFPAHQISKLPKGTKAQNECEASLKKNCAVCGGWHHPQIKHLDYVGHAALTDRLLDADPAWAWEPVAFTTEGLPAFDKTGGLWIRLTVCGVTRLGYGNAANKPSADVGSREKEVIGDALRNAAMRFGAALDLWHKGVLHADDEDDEPKTTTARPPANDTNPANGGPVDMTPAARARRIAVGVAGGDAVGAAIAMSEWGQPVLDAVWKALDAQTQDKLTAAWPKGHAA